MKFPPPDPSSRHVLKKVLDEAQRVGGRGVAVFDLDSTLFDNRPRQVRIFREFGEAKGIPEFSASSLEHWTSSWMMKEAVLATGLPEDRAVEIFDEVLLFWRERFFDPAYCLEDSPIAGAVEFVRAIHAHGVQVAYCTARHEPMRQATAASLLNNGFPHPGEERVHLLMKEGTHVVDDDFKREAHESLRELGTVFAAFDNEPTHINEYFRGFPEALVVHLATDHSGRDVEVHPAIPAVEDFVL